MPGVGRGKLGSMGYPHALTDGEKRELLRIARITLREFTRTGRIPPGKPHKQSLCENAAAFVTLRTAGTLRGCIGTQLEESPLYRTVQEMAVAAATRDPRFAPVRVDEVDQLIIEVSVIGSRERIASAADVEVGVHGLTIQHDGHRGLLLPQVARENDWDAETFLTRLCAKAGLPANSWREDEVDIERFTAQVFDEQTYPPAAIWN